MAALMTVLALSVAGCKKEPVPAPTPTPVKVEAPAPVVTPPAPKAQAVSTPRLNSLEKRVKRLEDLAAKYAK